MSVITSKLYGVLDSENFKKIFPQEYFAKFAPHLKVLQFEKTLFEAIPETGKLKFQKRQSKISKILNQQTSKSKGIKISKFTKINDTLNDDREQLKRFKSINKEIQENMNNPQLQQQILKKIQINEIKTIKNQEQIPIKIIDALMVQSNHQANQSINQKLQNLKKKQVICKFVKRNRQNEGKNSYKSKLEWKQMKRYNSQLQLNSKLSQQNNSKKLLMSSNSQLKINQSISNRLQQNNENEIKIEEQNRSIRQNIKLNFKNSQPNTLRLRKPRSLTKRQLHISKPIIKFDLINQTYKLKEKNKELKSLQYSTEVTHQPWKISLLSMLEQNIPKDEININI